jgi:DNA-binding winged helix-turn-helix (wHTH) protein/TolB-like protein/tetratricopeptide (TPR) repeat protein
MPSNEELHNGFEIGEWEVLPARGELRSAGQVIKPEPKVFKVLLALAARDGDVVTKDELIDEVWDGRATGDDPIIRCVHQLRGHFGDKQRPYQYVETLTKRGYCLKQQVRLKQPAQDTPVPAAGRTGVWRGLAVVAVVTLLAVIARPLIFNVNPATVGSIGVLPCENLSGHAEDQYLVDGFKEELVRTLHNIPTISVKPGRIAYPGLEVPEIAATLGVESVLFCAVQRDDDMLKVNYSVARGRDGINLSSGSITGMLDGIFALQEKLAATVRDDLLGTSQQRLVSSSRPASIEGYDRYMRGQHAFRQRGQPGNLEAAIELFEETIDLDPRFGPAYLSLATAHALLPDARNVPLAQAHARALMIIKEGIEADPSISEAAQAIFGFVYHKQKNWTLAEQAYVRATSGQVVDANAFNWYSLMLAGVGRLDKALEQALKAQHLDPSNGVINSRVAIAYTWLGDTQNAAEYFSRAERLGGSSPTYWLANALTLERLGQHELARKSTYAAVSLTGHPTDWIDTVFLGLRDPDQRQSGIVALDTAAAEGALNPQIELTLRAMLGDVDGAIRIATILARRDVTYEMDLLFLPELASLRQRPEFLGLMENLGITEYWDAAGCAWLNSVVRCPEDAAMPTA